jgi:pimeloyl-ACP methyl ester carboxylesterase
MGGAIALELALGNQDLRGLVLVGTGADYECSRNLFQSLENYEKTDSVLVCITPL